MRSYRLFDATVMMRWSHRMTYAVALCVVITASAPGQDAKPKRPVPKLTTEDVARERPTVQIIGGTSVPEVSPTTVASKAQAAKVTGAADKPDPELDAWRERVLKARERLKAAQRDAEQAELRTTQLRNQLGVSGGTAQDRNATVAELGRMGPVLQDLRRTVQAAETGLNELLEIGKQKGMSEAAGLSPVTASGEPNTTYYKDKFAKLNEALVDADRRIQLYDNRVRDLNGRVNSTQADRFSNSQIQQERDEAQQKLIDARQARDKAYYELEALRNEARRAGLPPGTFR